MLGLFRLAAGIIQPVSFDGDLGATGAGSTITGTTRTADVSPANSGVLTPSSVPINGGAGAIEKNINGAGFVAVGASITLTDGQTLQMRITGAGGVGDGETITLTNANGQVSQVFVLQRTS